MRLFYYCFVCALLLHAAPSAFGKNAPEAVVRQLRLLGIKNEKIEWIESLRLFEVISQRGVLYISEAGNDFIVGEWYGFTDDKVVPIVNHTAERKSGLAIEAVKKIDVKDTVYYPAVGKEKEALYIFTDPNCGYCRKFHTQVPDLNKAGVGVYYIAFPVIKRESRQDSINIWCAKDKRKAMDLAKSGRSIATADCRHPVDKQLAMGKALGVTGTPYIIAIKSKQSFAGFLPTDSLLERLGIR